VRLLHALLCTCDCLRVHCCNTLWVNAESHTRVLDRPEWTRFDDASVSVVGGWAAVGDACARGCLLPTVLFYERAASHF
jgi:hypothetical protein